ALEREPPVLLETRNRVDPGVQLLVGHGEPLGLCALHDQRLLDEVTDDLQGQPEALGQLVREAVPVHLRVRLELRLIATLEALDRNALAVHRRDPVARLAAAHARAARAEHEQRGDERGDHDQEADLKRLPVPPQHRDHRLALELLAPQARARPALLGHDPPRHGDESGMSDHPVERTNRLALDVPGPIKRLEGLDERPVGLALERLRDLVRLHDGRHVAEEDPARSQRRRDQARELPGLGQIEQDAVDRLLLGETVFHGPEPDHQIGHLAESHVNVGERPSRELVALLVSDDSTLRTDGSQKGERQGAGAGPGLQHAAAGIDVGPEKNHGQVLGIDDLGAARHLQDVLRQRGAQRDVAKPHRAPHPAALGLADHRVVRHPAAVGVERLRLAEKDQVSLTALIDEQDLLTVLEGKPVVHRVSRARGAGRKRAATNAASGVAALIQSAAGNPNRSATQPSAVTPSPPAPIAKPTIRPEAVPALRGRYACPNTTDTVKLEVRSAPKIPSMTNARAPRASRKSTPNGSTARRTHCMKARGPQRSASGPAMTVRAAPAPRKTKSSGPTSRGSAPSVSM